MGLLTPEMEELFAKTGSQEQIDDPVVIGYFFNPCGPGVFYATEYFPEDRTFFGFSEIHPGAGEWGYFSLDELESVRCPPFNLPIERELYSAPSPISKLCARAYENIRKELKNGTT